MSVYLYGANPGKNNPASQLLRRLLVQAGFRKTHAVDSDEDFTDAEGYCITFGAEALGKACHLTNLDENRGKMHACPFNENLLVFATLHPGYVYRNRKYLPLLREDLKLFKTFIQYDKVGAA